MNVSDAELMADKEIYQQMMYRILCRLPQANGDVTTNNKNHKRGDCEFSYS